MVISIEGINVAIEDIGRHRADNAANATGVEIVINGKIEKKTWADVRVGDIVRIHNRQVFPSDLVLISTSDAQQPTNCFVNTKSLDGETDNKLR